MILVYFLTDFGSSTSTLVGSSKFNLSKSINKFVELLFLITFDFDVPKVSTSFCDGIISVSIDFCDRLKKVSSFDLEASLYSSLTLLDLTSSSCYLINPSMASLITLKLCLVRYSRMKSRSSSARIICLSFESGPFPFFNVTIWRFPFSF